jgi:ubiquinone/menaquinone biosynthesis C-methylase UbiE
MEAAGYYVTNIDISTVVIDQMAEKDQQDYLVVDATRMPFVDLSFDIVLDKGTFDALAVTVT